MSVRNVDIKELFAAGAHFGHKTSRWHPKMSPYIHSERAGMHVIDLVKTVELLEPALKKVTETAAAGRQILLVSTKSQAEAPILALAKETDMPYVVNRWLGGLLTNNKTISGRIKHLKDLEKRMDSGELGQRYSKLEVQRYQEEIDGLNLQFGGIKEMPGLPGLVFVVDMVKDNIAVREARKLKIPVMALVDSNSDPSQIDFPIPCNDDAIKAIQLILDYVGSAIVEGRGKKATAARKPEGGKKPAEAAKKPEVKTEAKAAPAQKDKATASSKKAPAKKTSTPKKAVKKTAATKKPAAKKEK